MTRVISVLREIGRQLGGGLNIMEALSTLPTVPQLDQQFSNELITLVQYTEQGRYQTDRARSTKLRSTVDDRKRRTFTTTRDP